MHNLHTILVCMVCVCVCVRAMIIFFSGRRIFQLCVPRKRRTTTITTTKNTNEHGKNIIFGHRMYVYCAAI